MKRSTLGSGGQSSRSDEAEVRFGALAEASFLTSWGRVGSRVYVCDCDYLRYSDGGLKSGGLCPFYGEYTVDECTLLSWKLLAKAI